MTDAHARLLAARDVLNRAERAVGLRARDDIEHGSFSHPPGTDEQVRTHPSTH